jgi:GT2 family glycosyltransferase
VVICSRNRPRLLSDAVESILAGDEVPAEIIVVDQSDEPCPLPSAGARIRDCAIRHLICSGRGLSLGRNQGAAAALYELLVFTDDDMSADAHWLGELVRALHRAGPKAAVTGRVLAGRPELAGCFVPALVERGAPAVYEGRIERDVLAGGNMAVRRSTFLDLGGFDVRLGAGSAFPSAEDNDLGYRLLETRHKILYVPAAVLTHRAWRPASEYLGVRYAYGVGKGGYYAKHASLTDLHMLRRLIRDLAHRLVRGPRLLRHPRRALGEFAYAIGILKGLIAWAIGPSPSSKRRTGIAGLTTTRK